MKANPPPKRRAPASTEAVSWTAKAGMGGRSKGGNPAGGRGKRATAQDAARKAIGPIQPALTLELLAGEEGEGQGQARAAVEEGVRRGAQQPVAREGRPQEVPVVHEVEAGQEEQERLQPQPRH